MQSWLGGPHGTFDITTQTPLIRTLRNYSSCRMIFMLVSSPFPMRFQRRHFLSSEILGMTGSAILACPSFDCEGSNRSPQCHATYAVFSIHPLGGPPRCPLALLTVALPLANPTPRPLVPLDLNIGAFLYTKPLALRMLTFQFRVTWSYRSISGTMKNLT